MPGIVASELKLVHIREGTTVAPSLPPTPSVADRHRFHPKETSLLSSSGWEVLHVDATPAVQSSISQPLAIEIGQTAAWPASQSSVDLQFFRRLNPCHVPGLFQDLPPQDLHHSFFDTDHPQLFMVSSSNIGSVCRTTLSRRETARSLP